MVLASVVRMIQIGCFAVLGMLDYLHWYYWKGGDEYAQQVVMDGHILSVAMDLVLVEEKE